jgi:hypothetical protein
MPQQYQSVQLKIINRIKALAEDHKMVETYRFGFLTDVDDLPDYTTTTIYLVPNGGSYPSQGKINYNFDIVCFDMLLPDKTNLEAVLSDTLSILNDIYTELLYDDGDPENWTIISGATFTQFQERIKDYVAGNTLSITVSAFMEQCRTNLPFNS